MNAQLGLTETGVSLDQNIGAVAKVLMALNGVTQAQLADELGHAKATMYRRMIGQIPWTAEEVSRMSAYFGVQPGTFYQPVGELVPAAKSNVVPINVASTLRTSGSRWMFSQEAA